MSTLTQKRAAVGGEIGANGEFYEGGKFIATRDNAKGQVKKSKPAVPRKVQIAPYQWEMQPTPQSLPIFRHVGTELKITAFDYETKDCTLQLFMPYLEAPCNRITPERVDYLQAVCDRFNAGERWE